MQVLEHWTRCDRSHTTKPRRWIRRCRSSHDRHSEDCAHTANSRPAAAPLSANAAADQAAASRSQHRVRILMLPFRDTGSDGSVPSCLSSRHQARTTESGGRHASSWSIPGLGDLLLQRVFRGHSCRPAAYVARSRRRSIGRIGWPLSSPSAGQGRLEVAQQPSRAEPQCAGWP